MSDLNQPTTPPPSAPPPKQKRKKPPSRSQRWAEAVGNALAVLEQIEGHLNDLEEAASELRSVQEEYEDWKDNLPENLQSSALGEKLEAVSSLDIESAADTLRQSLDEVKGVFEEAEGIDLPQGFGRD